ncbi:3-deoxy-D-manno-octulosonic acid kinase [Granulosicoccus antarcticus]|uniref:3-deoxy-D-manno-octulosonic acid kinase n=1 Tax=Granulosicoccus antarcticus IMCC3135 TaxID=1192854 RepID=A0A2Z2NJX7_9GAMM|nr:3-deoxy-D-manno-octulosonic acid kinase [Granulosicoccus antarcticus]ASJ71479.1 3-deoxy-D-manno-octulosonic acid kinase [Granulosicoccus antarcticus IMCC3135]
MIPIVTECPDKLPGTTWRYCQVPDLAFDPIIFDEQQLSARKMITGAAKAGRGNTFFFTFGGQALVLRHYHRGGLVQRLSKDRYLFTGLERTRSMHEFDVMAQLHQQGFPVSVPYACQVVHQGLFYRASLVTHKLDAQTLAERLATLTLRPLTQKVWADMGETLARLHAKGIYHADLNAHNIMLNEDNDKVSVIDFDRAQPRTLPAGNPASGWCLSNIQRLERSLVKISSDDQAYADGLATLKHHWAQNLKSLTAG